MGELSVGGRKPTPQLTEALRLQFVTSSSTALASGIWVAHRFQRCGNAAKP